MSAKKQRDADVAYLLERADGMGNKYRRLIEGLAEDLAGEPLTGAKPKPIAEDDFTDGEPTAG